MSPISHATFSQLQTYFHQRAARPHAELALQHVRQGVRVQSCFVLDDRAEDWKTFFEDSLKQLLDERKGYLYVASSTAQPEWFKLGKTGLAPESRMKALNNESVLGEIHCEFSLPVHDRHFCETAAHKWLQSRKAPRKKEFFKASLEVMKESCIRAFELDFLNFVDQDLKSILPEPFVKMVL